MSNYTPDSFDKALSKAIKLLMQNEIVTQTQLAYEIGIDRSVLSNVIALRRGLPIHMKDLVINRLVETYGVRREFLRTNAGAVLSQPLPVDPSAVPQYQEILSENDRLRQRVADLEKQIKSLTLLTETQALLIEKFKGEK